MTSRLQSRGKENPDGFAFCARDRPETAIVLTAQWHERDAQSLVERLGVATPVLVHHDPTSLATSRGKTKLVERCA